VITITNNEFSQLASYIKANYGINLKEEKQALVTGRLQNVLIQKGFNNFTEYYNYILKDKSGEAVVTLLNKITTNHTFFLREEDHFYYLRDNILPILTSQVKSKDLRIWSAGCSSGEEPYTIAMLLDEFFGPEKLAWDTKVLATDISSKKLEEAQNGIYNTGEISVLPSSWKLKYFNRYDNENSILNERLRKEVIYRKFNLMEEKFPFKKKFHVIFCRNVMIYFDAQTKQELVDKFYDSLEYGGYLFIGHSEAINRETTKLKFIKPAIYKKE
jgi:chemotaxis protein methyltransferase CheR